MPKKIVEWVLWLLLVGFAAAGLVTNESAYGWFAAISFLALLGWTDPRAQKQEEPDARTDARV